MNNKNELSRFSISLPTFMLQNIDEKIKDSYSSRSEFIRDILREKMLEEKWEKDNNEDYIAVLVIIYNHHQKELNQKMIDIQHNNQTNILCNTHIHINHNNCLESIMLKGTRNSIEKLSLEIGGLKGVQFYKLIKVTSF